MGYLAGVGEWELSGILNGNLRVGIKWNTYGKLKSGV